MTTTAAQGQEFAAKTLAHFGVKGMKWGVRKDRGHEGERVKTKKLKKLDKKYEREFSGVNGFIKVNNTFASHINPMIDVLNAKPEYAGKDISNDKELHTKYWNEVEGLVTKAAEQTTASFGTNASGTKQMKVTRDGFGENANWQAQIVDVKVEHAATRIPLDEDGLDGLSFTITPVVNKLGQLVSFKFSQNGIKHEDSIEAIIAHYGVKGMKWGVRKDRGAQEVTVYTRPGKKVTARGGKRHGPAPEAMQRAATTQKSKHSTTDSLTNKELKEAIDRMNLERQYNKLTGENMSLGQKFVRFLLREGGDLAASKVNSVVAGAVEDKIKQ